MDPRRLVIAAAGGLALGGCAQLSRLEARAPTSAVPAAVLATTPALPPEPPAGPGPDPPVSPPLPAPSMAPIPNPPGRPERAGAKLRPPAAAARGGPAGPAAIAAANSAARETSRAQGFRGGAQVFAYQPGEVYEVWTAPLRVTTITLSAGETVISKAAGDTVRWQIGETESGEGPGRRANVMIKPLRRGLETNLVLATNRRIYLIQLRSGPPASFNAVVTWDPGAILDDPPKTALPAAAAGPGLAAPQGPLDAHYRILVKGRRPVWTPSAVMTDGARTFLSFPPELFAGEAPSLFVVSPEGETQLVNYRQQGGLWVVDRVLDAAELRIGGRKAQVVRIERLRGSP